MEERFSTVFSLPANLFSEGSPIIISAGSLLNDTKTNSLIAQLKFQNIGAKTIRALKICLMAKDISGEDLGLLDEYHYLDLNVNSGEYFGSDKAIVFPDNRARSFSISKVCVVFADAESYTLASALLPLDPLKSIYSILSEPELLKQYEIETKTKATYIPLESKELWLCTCGTWNKKEICSHCLSKRKVIIDNYNIDILKEKYQARLQEEQIKKEKADEAERIKKEERKEKNNAIKKFLKITSGIVGSIVILVLLTIKVIVPNIKYNQAVEYRLNNEFDASMTQFEELGDFKDSAEQVKKTVYAKAEYFLNEKEFSKSAETFLSIKDYSDSYDRYLAVKYTIAENLLLNADYDKATEAFLELEKYSDSLSKAYDAQYQKAESYLNNCEFDEAISVFSSIIQYSDSENRIKESYYSKADKLFSEKKYIEAADSYKEANDYEDAKEKINESYYQEALSLKSSKDYNKAIEYFTLIKTYKDSKSQINDCNTLKLKNAQKGDIVLFGDKKPGTEWVVLDRKGTCLFLLTSKPVASKAYNDDYSAKPWPNSSIRKWLNSDFYNNYFSDEDKKCIVETALTSVQKDGTEYSIPEYMLFGNYDDEQMYQWIVSQDKTKTYKTNDNVFLLNGSNELNGTYEFDSNSNVLLRDTEHIISQTVWGYTSPPLDYCYTSHGPGSFEEKYDIQPAIYIDVSKLSI